MDEIFSIRSVISLYRGVLSDIVEILPFIDLYVSCAFDDDSTLRIPAHSIRVIASCSLSPAMVAVVKFISKGQ